MKSKRVFVFLAIIAQLQFSFANYTDTNPKPERRFILTALAIGTSLIKFGTACVGLYQQIKNGNNIKPPIQNQPGTSHVVAKLDEIHKNQTQQANEIYVNTMLTLNGIEGKLDAVQSQIVDLNGKIIDVSRMLNKIDGTLTSVHDLVLTIDKRMDRFSEQV